MKAILVFTLPEEEGEYRMAVDGPRLASDIEEFRAWLRGKIKYTDLTQDVNEFAQLVWSQLHTLVRGVSD